MCTQIFLQLTHLSGSATQTRSRYSTHEGFIMQQQLRSVSSCPYGIEQQLQHQASGLVNCQCFKRCHSNCDILVQQPCQ